MIILVSCRLFLKNEIEQMFRSLEPLERFEQFNGSSGWNSSSGWNGSRESDNSLTPAVNNSALSGLM
jgi:hypothetical protein